MFSSSRGQALPYFLFMLVVLVLSWGMMLNISKLLCDRIAMQNAADNAVLSAAVNQARTINLIAKINNMMARVLYDSTFAVDTHGWGSVHPEDWGSGIGVGTFGDCILAPITPQALRDNVTRVGSTMDIFPSGYSICWYGRRLLFHNERRDAGVRAIMLQMSLLNDLQEGIFMIGPANSGKIARHIAKKQGTEKNIHDSDETIELGIFNDIKVFLGASASNTDIFFRPGSEYATGALSLGLVKNTERIEYYGAEHSGGSIIPNPFLPPGGHAHYVHPYRIGYNYCNLHRRYESWYYADSKNFYKKRLIVCVRKKADVYKNTPYPLFRKWIGIEWPDLMAAGSASIYNKTGDNHGRPSFVLKSSPWKGTAIKEDIEAYDDSKDGGWYAHLTSVGGMLH